ncbi:hypothetical protein CEXT_60981 [Caerostris extrusa]|uniref:Uncharacterized protein n=1 Tax=Caerostris extrusa TaxID=172846 RepID=A0AAV4PEA1_CAEEX|nr:hypothetical protein CEXT_60981 [Caerostris extrusa]
MEPCRPHLDVAENGVTACYYVAGLIGRWCRTDGVDMLLLLWSNFLRSDGMKQMAHSVNPFVRKEECFNGLEIWNGICYQKVTSGNDRQLRDAFLFQKIKDFAVFVFNIKILNRN